MPITTQVYRNVDSFIRRAGTMGYMGENQDKVSTTGLWRSACAENSKSTDALPMVHAIVTLISQATSPSLLAQMGDHFMPWF